MIMGVDVSIIIVNYNTKILTEQCLKSIYQHTTSGTFEIIVVDNASTDGSAKMIRSEFPNVVLVCAEKNMGFGVANNLAIDIARGRYYLFLNSDTIFLNNVIEFFLKHFLENPDQKIGCLGTCLLDSKLEINGFGAPFPSNILVFKSILHSLFRKVGYTPFKQKKKKKHFGEIDYVLGADMFIPAEVISTIGKFDPIYFMYYEEADLQLRMKTCGYKRKIIDGPEIIHLEGKSLNIKYDKLIIIKKSGFLYFKKNTSFFGYLLFRVISLIECIGFFVNLKSSFSFAQKLNYLKFNLLTIKKINESCIIGK